MEDVDIVQAVNALDREKFASSTVDRIAERLGVPVSELEPRLAELRTNKRLVSASDGSVEFWLRYRPLEA